MLDRLSTSQLVLVCFGLMLVVAVIVALTGALWGWLLMIILDVTGVGWGFGVCWLIGIAFTLVLSALKKVTN